MRTAQPATVKKIAQDAVSTATATGIQSNLDAYEQRLGESEETVKDALGVEGFTSIFEDIGTLRTKIGVGTTIKGGLDAIVTQAGGAANQTVTAAVGGGLAADDITARIDRQPPTTNRPDIDAAILDVDDQNAPAGTLTQAIGAVREQIFAADPAGDSLRKLAADQRARIGAGGDIDAATTALITNIKTAATGGGDVALTLLNAQIDRIDRMTPKLETALDTTVELFGVTAPVALASHNAELTAERTALLAWINGNANNLIAAHAYAPVDPADALVFDGANNNDPITAGDPLNTIHKLLLFARGAINL